MCKHQNVKLSIDGNIVEKSVDDFSYGNGVITFHVGNILYGYNFELKCIQHDAAGRMYIDCTALRALGT